MNIFYKMFLVMLFVGFSQQTVSPQLALDPLTKRDLELVDSVNGTHCGVGSALAPLQTSCGKAIAREMLLSPTQDTGVIAQRQNVIKALINDPVSLDKVRDCLAGIAVQESALDFFDQASTPESLRSIMSSFEYSLPWLTSLNESPFALDIRHITHSFSPLITTVFEFFVLHFALEYLQDMAAGSNKHHHHKHKHDHDHGHDHGHGDCGCIHHMHAPQGASPVVKALVWLAKAGHVALHLVSVKDMAEFITTKMMVMDQVYQQLLRFRSIVGRLHQVETLIDSNAAFNGLLKLESLGSFSALLEDDYFVEDENLSLFSGVGKTVVSYAQVAKEADALAQLKQTIGLLDVYSSLAKVIQQRGNDEARFCFATFTDEKQPTFEMVKGWHVMLNGRDHAIVSNSFQASGDTKYILSGPNGSGKSSFLRTLGLNVVLAQSFGIAAAQKFVISPFARIFSFMTIADDIVTGQSSFIARMIRADECIKQQELHSRDEFTLLLLDDSLGQGTTADRGEAVAYEFIKRLGDGDNNILLAASHYDRVKALGTEAGSRFKNIRMRIAQDHDGHWQGTYMLGDGLSSAQEVSALTH